MNNEETLLPLSERSFDNVPGHWLLARLGKRVLRPGGAKLTTDLLRAAALADADVVELAPGLGRTAAEIIAAAPRSYTGVDQDPDAARIVSAKIGAAGRCITADASSTGLPDRSADVVIGEAMLTMQSDRGKRAIIAEAARLLRPGGRYAIHELALQPDDVDPAVATDFRQALARSIKVNATPLTVAEWRALLEEHDLRVESVAVAPMALLQIRRNISDEGIRGCLRIAGNLLRHPAARRRVMAMRTVFRRNRHSLIAVAIVATSGPHSAGSFAALSFEGNSSWTPC